MFVCVWCCLGVVFDVLILLVGGLDLFVALLVWVCGVIGCVGWLVLLWWLFYVLCCRWLLQLFDWIVLFWGWVGWCWWFVWVCACGLLVLDCFGLGYVVAWVIAVALVSVLFRLLFGLDCLLFICLWFV